MLVANYKEMKGYVPTVEMKGVPSSFDDALFTAQETLVADILGTALEAQLENRNPADKNLLKKVQRVIALEAFLKSIPMMDLILTDSGFGVVNSQDLAPASKERIANLTASVQTLLDEAKDALVTYLLASNVYADWRGTEEFARLSDGLILTFQEFRDMAVFNNTTAPVYPKTWSEFLRLNSALNVALTADVAAYISPDYADEILEKIRDREIFLPREKVALKLIKMAVAAFALGDRENGTALAIKAAAYMKANIDDFPTFADSSAAADLSNEHTDTPIFFML